MRITTVLAGNTIKIHAFGAKRALYTVWLIRIYSRNEEARHACEYGRKDATSNMLVLT